MNLKERENGNGKKNIWRIEKQNHKLTSTCATKEKRNIQSRNQCFRTCNWRSLIIGIGREMETHHIFIKDNTSSQKKLQDIWQEITSHSGSLNKIEIISIKYYREIQSLDRPWEPQVFLRTI